MVSLAGVAELVDAADLKASVRAASIPQSRNRGGFDEPPGRIAEASGDRDRFGYGAYRARLKAWSGGCCGDLIGDTLDVIPFRRMSPTAPLSPDAP
jgi:hypothetical protein